VTPKQKLLLLINPDYLSQEYLDTFAQALEQCQTNRFFGLSFKIMKSTALTPQNTYFYLIRISHWDDPVFRGSLRSFAIKDPKQLHQICANANNEYGKHIRETYPDDY